MKKLLLFLLAIVAVVITALSSSASKSMPPDLEQIRRATTDRESQYYYPKLMKLYWTLDTAAMTEKDYEYLYYGYLFQEDYNPYRFLKESNAEYKEIEHLYRKGNNSKLEASECRRLIKYAEKVLHDNPFDLVQINYMIAALEQIGKVNIANIWRSKLAHILQTIANSGTGLTQESAWYVVLPNHEVDFFNMMGISATGQTYQEPHYDYITVNPKSPTAPKGYYFNLGPMLEQYYRKHPSELD